MEKEKKKFSWTQNAVTYSIATILLLFGGQILGGIIVGMVAGIMIIIITITNNRIIGPNSLVPASSPYFATIFIIALPTIAPSAIFVYLFTL